MDKQNAAYDLSLYEEQQSLPVRTGEKQAKVIKVKMGLGHDFKKMCNVLAVTVMLSLVIAVINTNANITTTATEIAKKQAAIIELESEKSYLNFSIESRMSLKNIEEYAVGELGLVKMESAQVEYIEIEDENKIEVIDPEFKDKVEEAVKPILSYLLP